MTNRVLRTLLKRLRIIEVAIEHLAAGGRAPRKTSPEALLVSLKRERAGLVEDVRRLFSQQPLWKESVS